MDDPTSYLSTAYILHEDEHLLVVNKPPGLNTHSPTPYAGEGIYEWLRNREPRWATLGIMQRLDRETSGVLVFTKTPLANKSLNDQFLARSIAKTYLLVTDQAVPEEPFTVETRLERRGEKRVPVPLSGSGDLAVTRFRRAFEKNGLTLVEAEPVTGKTHQIRVHAASRGFPILGDALYGGTASHRLHLHSHTLLINDPEFGFRRGFTVPAKFEVPVHQALRDALIEPARTTAYRLIHGAADGHPGVYVDRFGDWLLVQSTQPSSVAHNDWLRSLWLKTTRGVYYKSLTRETGHASPESLSPQHQLGEAAPDEFTILENGVHYAIRFNEGYSVGLFLDQRDNRRRILTNHIGPEFPIFEDGMAGKTVLNTFAYTCGFSTCAALAGARTTSLDLSKSYLEWGKRNFVLNQRRPVQSDADGGCGDSRDRHFILNPLAPEAHDFLHGDVFNWLKRFAKKARIFDAVLLDPPTFSRSKESGVFQAENDYPELVRLAVKVLKPGGVLFASTNAAKLDPEEFIALITTTITAAGRKIVAQQYIPQPPDFPIRPEEPGYLKTIWFKIG